MSEYVATANCANETPRHDTSIEQEQDSARLTLKRIDQVSDLLSKYVG
ncbi:hypothetical protein Anas_10179 [Armadillidium nasatum]|uniref:Uncharacterized protein n=1 Tax=Armadillidium nasatum TaxID=96803 RepID=A0A5N5SQ14_9CRUS|nr:hypothetical protein Anas_10179 [Armadillidium nasatum]